MNIRKITNPLILKVIAYHGSPKDVNGIPTLDKIEAITKLSGQQIVNDPYRSSDDDNKLDELLMHFQSKHNCKIAYLDGNVNEPFREFEVFEPSWSDPFTAHATAYELASLLVEYAQGH